MFDRILVICEGNVCRSPVAAEMLRALRPEKAVRSAGIRALEGRDLDETARAVAREQGLECQTHAARTLSPELSRWAEVILVMEARQREFILEHYPEVSGKTFLITHWNGRGDIADPFRRDREVYEHVHRMLNEATAAWADKIR